jgi:N6-adenosine-specific RNA methylase IME4
VTRPRIIDRHRDPRLVAARGHPTVTLTNQSTLLLAPSPPRGLHSAKPVEFYKLVESLCLAPRYADLFSRYHHNERWDRHGDEAPMVTARAQAPPRARRHAERMAS